jgi:hypothetical protein
MSEAKKPQTDRILLQPVRKLALHMTKNVGIFVFLALFGATAASADIFTDYTVNFTGAGTLPTAGSFTYDQTNPHFSSFLVTFDGVNFDLTSSANGPRVSPTPPSCLGGLSGAAASFALLSGSCVSGAAAGFPNWLGESGPTSGMTFETEDGLGNFIEVNEEFSTSRVNGVGGEGGWTITSKLAPVPEPTSAILMATMLAIASFLARKRFGQKPRHAAIE